MFDALVTLARTSQNVQPSGAQSGGSKGGSSWKRRAALLVASAVAAQLVRRLRSRGKGSKRKQASSQTGRSSSQGSGQAKTSKSSGGGMLRKAGLFVGLVGATVAARTLRRRLAKSGGR